MRFAAILLSLAILLIQAPSVYAGKIDLSTYYPSPYGEYTELKASKSLKIPFKPAKVTDPSQVKPGEIWFEPK